MSKDFTEYFMTDEDIPKDVVTAAFKLSLNEDFRKFMKWWLNEQKNYADNLLSGNIKDSKELFGKVKYLQGQKADANLILQVINQLKKTYELEKKENDLRKKEERIQN